MSLSHSFIRFIWNRRVSFRVFVLKDHNGIEEKGAAGHQLKIPKDTCVRVCMECASEGWLKASQRTATRKKRSYAAARSLSLPFSLTHAHTHTQAVHIQFEKEESESYVATSFLTCPFSCYDETTGQSNRHLVCTVSHVVVWCNSKMMFLHWSVTLCFYNYVIICVCVCVSECACLKVGYTKGLGEG